ncbi:NifU family protein [Papillibacter cinnamivorans]|uniref:Fe-S cluster biogenesis protein NfuA, 4Fe-4S-binding domain n=1 Tax=Papillibacter cinnamivorans DSM 12816 TaxID=1122930 RepID=A0A1W2AHW0_9FIRM|nr:NifU family protein [Papillibacter cinnamivorans]SMC60295.1 Fe-S cluster biogenesis protein NfuA, 4Fe-4S-binding domain [Papillibacter cinnamivorans DSM 12816]
MDNELLSQIEAVLDERVRPALLTHGGGVRIVEIENGVVKARMLGQCSSCPAAALTNEQLIEAELREALPWVERVVLVTETDPELLNMARSILRQRREQEKEK